MGIEKVNKIVVVIHHASPEAQENWKINVQPAWMNIIKYTINGDFEVKFYEMEPTENDLSKGMTV